MSALNTRPAQIEQGATENKVWAIDFAASLAVGEVISSVVTALLDITNNKDSYALGLSGSPSISNTIINQRVTNLVVDHSYVLQTTITTSASNKYEAIAILNCPSNT